MTLTTPQQLTRIRARNFGLKSGSTTLFSGLDLDLKAPGLIGIFGASGTGKTSLLRAMARLLVGEGWGYSGRLSINARDVADWNEIALRRRAVYVSQSPQAFHGSMLDNLSLPQRVVLRRRDPTEIKAVALEAAALAQLPHGDEWLERDAARLSGGQLARLALARALTLDPEILLLDEPTGALDPENAVALGRTLQALGRRKLVLVATHDARIGSFCTHTVFLGRSGGFDTAVAQRSKNESIGSPPPAASNVPK